MTQSRAVTPPTGPGGDTTIPVAVKALSTGEKVQQVELVTAVDGGAATAISAGNPLEVAIVGTVPISGAPTTVTANLGTIAGAATETTLAAVNTKLGSSLPLPTGAATQTTLAAVLSALGTPLQAGGNVAVTSSALPTGAATAAKQPALGTPGTPSNDTITIQGSGSGTPVPVSGTFTANPQSDVASSGSLTGAAQTIASGALNGAATAIFDVSGTFVATLTVQATVDGTNWFAVTGLRDASNTNGSFAAVSTITTTGRYEVPVGGFANVRVNSTAYTSGSAIISLRVSTGATVLPVALGANQSVNQAQVNGTTTDTNNGTTSAGTQRVTLSSDSTGQVKLAAGTAAIGSLTAGAAIIGALTANQSINNAQINGVAPLMGNGVSGTGAQRVTIASDSTGQIALAAGTATVGKVVPVVATTGGASTISLSITTTVTSIKASAGQLYGWHVFNGTAATAYVQIFDLATGSVTLGTTAPKLSLGIPAGGGATLAPDVAIAFATAISVACTTTRAGLTPPASSIDLNFLFA